MTNLSTADVRRAIEIIEECRNIHVQWADFFDANPDEKTTPAPLAETAGDQVWHRTWVDNYDKVLGVLNQLESAK